MSAERVARVAYDFIVYIMAIVFYSIALYRPLQLTASKKDTKKQVLQ